MNIECIPHTNKDLIIFHDIIQCYLNYATPKLLSKTIEKIEEYCIDKNEYDLEHINIYI